MTQPKDNSPLSRFGIGEPVSDHLTQVASMGGLGASYSHIYQGNISNPASYGYLQATALELSLFAKQTWLKSEDRNRSVWSGNIEYFSLSIPLINPLNELLERRESDFFWGLNISLLPYSQVGYSIASTDEIDSIGTVSRTFEGQGGTNRFNIGNGWRYKNFAVGLNIGYLFGELSYQNETVFDDLVNNFEYVSRNDVSVRGFLWNAGAQYDFDLGESERQNSRRLTLGMTYNSSTSFDTKADRINFALNPFFQITDTAEFVLDQEGRGMLPGKFSFGARFEESTRLSLGVDFEQVSWSDYMNEARPESLSNTWRVALGGSYTPDFTSISSYLSRVQYRAGLYYQTDPRSLEGDQVNQYGISAGMGLPFVFQRFFSYVHFGVDYGRRSASDSLKENYLRFRLGFTLNDNRWFLKRRYN